jgi:hypothetical protein
MNQSNDLLFSKSLHNKLQKNVETEYSDFIDDIREDLKKGFTTDVVDSQFLDQLNDIVHDEAFDTFSPVKFYWMNLVDNLIYIIQLHEEILNADDYNEGSEDLSESEDELFTLWNDSELAKMFLDILNEGLPVIEASDQLLPLLENQIISFYVIHINQFQQEFDDAIIYQAVGEFGDFEKRVYIGDQHRYIDFDKIPDGFPSLPLKSIKPQKDEIVFELKEEDIKFKIKNNPHFIKFEGSNLYILPNCEQGIKKLKTFSESIESALKRIKIAAPHLITVFSSFTHTIVPVNEEGIVSYSMQSLPGYSSINMFNRDQIDLMDDLLHENGHHYLNTYLNNMDLINEDDDKIYYSPWRKALRPIRGIYHATFTFFWALELFYWLNKSIDNKKIKFADDEILKIRTRFLEEFYMLDYCWKDLEHAFKNKKINKQGMDLIKQIYKRINDYKKDVEQIESNLQKISNENYKQILELKSHLKKTREHYKL